MAATVDLRLIELLCSRLCHELINPIGAVGNGVELLTELGGTDPEALGLIGQSARLAGQRLQFYRVAYGQASGMAAELTLGEAGALAEGALAGPRTRIDWPQSGPVAARRIAKPTLKLLLNLAVIAAEALPRGGKVSLRTGPEAGSGTELGLSAEGEQAGIAAETRAALAGAMPADGLTPRTVHAAFTRALAGALGLAVVTAEAPGRVDVRIGPAARG